MGEQRGTRLGFHIISAPQISHIKMIDQVDICKIFKILFGLNQHSAINHRKKNFHWSAESNSEDKYPHVLHQYQKLYLLL